jgi:hypothetical protein
MILRIITLERRTLEAGKEKLRIDVANPLRGQGPPRAVVPVMIMMIMTNHVIIQRKIVSNTETKINKRNSKFGLSNCFSPTMLNS